MNDIATAQHEIKLHMVEASRTLFANDRVNVSFGHPGERRDLDDIVAWTELRTEQDPGPLSASNRSSDENIFLTVMISVFRAGEQDDDLVPATAATDYLRRLERYVRFTNTTLDGLCLHCRVSSTNSGGRPAESGSR